MRTLEISAAVLALSIAASTAHAIPRFGVRAGAPCRKCHVDPAGGGMRNDFGRNVYAGAELAMPLLHEPTEKTLLDVELSDSIALGGDLRVLYLHFDRPDSSTTDLSSFYSMESSLHFQAELFDLVTVQVSPTLHGSESLFFEATGTVRLPWVDSYVKVGRFTPPYGYKLATHTAFIRKQLGFNVRTKDVGLELGAFPGPIAIQLALTNGTSERAASDWDDNFAKAISGRASFIGEIATAKVELGLSGYYNIAGRAKEDDPSGEDTRIGTVRAGVFGGISLGRFTYLGEADISRVDDRMAPEVVTQLFTYQELAFLAMRGLEIVATYELWDQNTTVGGDAAHRFGGNVELHPLPHLEVSVGYRHTHADDRHPLARLHEGLAMAHFHF